MKRKSARHEMLLFFKILPSNLGDVLQHGHAGHLLLNDSVIVDLVPKLSSVGCVIHLKMTMVPQFP